MAQKIINTRLQIRNDTAAQWTLVDPVLLPGECGFESDTRKMKFGDGVSKWSELQYAGADAAQIQSLIDAAEDRILVVEPNEGEEDIAACARIYENEQAQGDMCVVKRAIGDTDKIAHTAYVFDGENWKAMDGNYNAENVYFADDIDVTTTVGLITSLTNGKATWRCGGKNIKQAMQVLFAEEKQPSKTNPGATISTWTLSKAAGNYEAGTAISGTATYALALNGVGSYTYGPTPVGVGESGVYSVSYSCDNTSGNATTGTKTDKSGSFDYSFTLGDNTKHVKITSSSVGYTGATNKANTNLGNETAVQITAGTASAGTKDSSFSGFRYWYVGGLNDTDTLDSAKIKGSLTAKQSGTGLNGTNEFKASSYNGGTIKRMVIAIPVSASKTVKSVLLKSASNADITGEFKEKAQVSVEGASTGYATNYRVWEYMPASLSSTEVYTITVG